MTPRQTPPLDGQPILNLTGYTDVPPGKVATVVTCLEMTSPRPRQAPDRSGEFDLDPVSKPDIDWYLKLYSQIGDPHLWYSRRVIGRQDLAATLHDPFVDVYVLMSGVEEIGLVELDRRVGDAVEIAFFGLTPEAVGRGAGRFLMDEALSIAWSYMPARVWLHTCTLDHPSALPFYLSSGFVPYARKIEIFDDPRLSGVIGAEVAPNVPVIG